MKITYNRLGVMLAGVALFLGIAMLLIWRVQDLASERMLKQQAYEQGLALTTAISKSIWRKFSNGDTHSPEMVVKKYPYDMISEKINRILEGTPVLKLKLFDSDGRMRYSSNKKDIVYGDGDDLHVEKKINMVALDVIKNKQPFSSYRFRKAFDDGEKIYRDKYIFSVYIPAYIPPGEKVGGVVEIYYDVTNIVSEFYSNSMLTNATLYLTGFSLFLLIGYLIIRNDKITRKRENERETYLEMIKQKNRDLVAKTREVTAVKERTEKIAEERSAFISRMSHELRTPMNAVIGLADLIMRTSLTDKQRGYVNAIQSSGNILLDITDEILTIGRLETGYLEIKKQEFVLRDVIENVLEIMGNRAYREGLELILDYTPELENRVSGDPVRLRQILLNLVGNAVKYTESGLIRIHVGYFRGNFGAHHYRFEVSDTGIGINEDDQARVFSAYCHLHHKNAGSENSTGLGLAISKRLVEAMNGVIGVDSAEDEGAVFWFKLPLHTVEEARAETLLLPDIENNKTLVVTDSEESGKCIVDALTYWGMDCDFVCGYEDVDRLIEQSFFDVNPYSMFVVDSDVKDGNGVKLARKIREHSALNNSPVILMVPISESLDRGVVSGLKNTICINKPILPGRLKQLIVGLSATNTNAYEKEIMPKLKHISSGISCYCGEQNQQNRVLIVEDNPVNRELLMEMLHELGVSGVAVETGGAAIDALMHEAFNLILLDSRLPDMDGHEVTAKIRNMALKAGQPVIIVTSSDNSLQNQQLSYEHGVDEFLHKPIKLEDLHACLQSWIPEVELLVDRPTRPVESNSTVVSLFAAPILDKEVVASLKNHSADNPDFFSHLINIFINDSFERIDKLKNQLEEANYTGVERSAHSIKSGCLHIGAKRMAKYCEVLSNMARNQSYPETQRALKHFIEEFDRLLIELDSEQRLVPEPL